MIELQKIYQSTYRSLRSIVRIPDACDEKTLDMSPTLTQKGALRGARSDLERSYGYHATTLFDGLTDDRDGRRLAHSSSSTLGPTKNQLD